jgi:hypothetical protein
MSEGLSQSFLKKTITLDESEQYISAILSTNASQTFSPQATNPITFIKNIIELAEKNKDQQMAEQLKKWAQKWARDLLLYTPPDQSGYIGKWRELLGQISIIFPPGKIKYPQEIQMMILKIKI